MNEMFFVSIIFEINKTKRNLCHVFSVVSLQIQKRITLKKRKQHREVISFSVLLIVTGFRRAGAYCLKSIES